MPSSEREGLKGYDVIELERDMMVTKSTPVIVAIVVLAVVIGAYLLYGAKKSYGTTSVPATSTPQVTQQTSQPTTTVSTGGTTQTTTAGSTTTLKVDRFTVVEKEYSFSPSVLTVKSGETVVIASIDNGTVSHDFIVQGLSGASTPVISSGQNYTLSFIAPAPGNYTFYCGVDGHRQLGMVGTLVVR